MGLPIYDTGSAFELHAFFGVLVELDADAVGVGGPALPTFVGTEFFVGRFVAIVS